MIFAELWCVGWVYVGFTPAPNGAFLGDRNFSSAPASIRCHSLHNSRRTVMKHLIIPLLLIGGFVALTTAEANAVVCARGVYRAGCVSAGGAAVVAPPVVLPVALAAVVPPRVAVRRTVS